MRLVCISDTHMLMPDLPNGDVLIHAGDVCAFGTMKEFQRALAWLTSQPHKVKLLVAGNHDRVLQTNPILAESLIPPAITYLRDNAVIVDGVKFYGSPWQPEFHDWAFNLPRGSQLARVWKNIPDNTDVLITHGPAYGTCDMVEPYLGIRSGCMDLRDRILKLPQLQLHICGHIHEGYGMGYIGSVPSYNVSHQRFDSRPHNPAIVIGLPLTEK